MNLKVEINRIESAPNPICVENQHYMSLFKKIKNALLLTGVRVSVRKHVYI
ncbi:MAG: hypothetical protein JWQ09_140 [Segetibacter sp.]|nr:hypothetical protein [Segetibacter sp.]